MCGIAGWFNKHNSVPNRKAQINRMIDSIRHRGPDGNGSQIFKHAVLGHTRLTIIDKKTGEQPLSNPNFPVSIIFNGEIYNYKELRKNLKQSGFPFTTHSDTEVILALYLSKGINGFKHLQGMYAFAIWDERTLTGYLVRDPIGIKPLFYSESDNRLLFASEAKAICTVRDSKNELNESSLHLVMNFRYLPGEQTLFKGIKQLPPGQILEWSIEKQQFSRIAVEQSTQNNLYDEMINSINRHLVSDVPVSGYLSGGIDSALISSIVRKTQPEFTTYTLDIGDDPNEAVNAAATAKSLNIKNYQDKINLNIEKDLKKLIWHLEVPKINALQSYHLSRFASHQHKVVLSGLGADELFMGYNIHQIFYYLYQSRFLPKWFKQALSVLIKTNNTIPFSESNRISGIFSKHQDWPEIYALLRNVWDAPALRTIIYGERLLDAPLPQAQDYINEHWDDNLHPLLALRNFEWQNKMVNDLLWHEDRCSMAFGLESRVPYLDTQLQSLVWKYPINQLFPMGKKKYLLKKIAQTLLPHDIINRPKSGFQVNSPVFFKQHLSKMAETYLSPECTKKHQLFNIKFIQKVLTLPEKKQYRWHYFMLYLMLMTHLWLEQFENDNI